MGDITDWYAEEIQLDADGAPSASLFDGAWEPLSSADDSIVVADIAILGSTGRTEVITRWSTFDGRWITSIEGREVDDEYLPMPGETVANFAGVYVVPEDTDGDSVISAISFAYAGFDVGPMFRTLDDFGQAADVEELREATKGLVAYSQNIVAADSGGSILYASHQGMPCRDHLDRNGDGTWATGADPGLLLDGTRYGSFEVPLTSEGEVDFDGAACVVPFDQHPWSIDPPQGYLQTANNDPGGLSIDGSLTNDPWYLGGPWTEGYRAKRIDAELARMVAAGGVTLDDMVVLQGDHHSGLGEQLLPELLDVVDQARAASASGDRTDLEEILAGLYDGRAADIEDAYDRLVDWQTRGLTAGSGVETFYHSPDADDVADAIATSIFNAWMTRFVSSIFDDEALPGIWEPTTDTGRLRMLTWMLDGRGADNPLALASWNEDTLESAFFDVLGTDEVEQSQQLVLQALLDGFDHLGSQPDGDEQGGFGSSDPEDWLWGLRHVAKFESLLSEFLDVDDAIFGSLVEDLSITTDVLPLGDDVGVGDPRRDLTWFPRPGDHLNVDAGNSGLTGNDADYGSGPVFRMVFALGPDGVEGYNVLPGGQSGLTDSEHFADQAALWLGNEALPMHLAVEDVVANALHRETFEPG